jgi:hypothetical protein
MKRIKRVSLLAIGLSILGGLAGVVPGFRPLAELQAANDDNNIAYDVACDCRTGVSGPNRGDPFIIQGKIFPVGTLPSGNATNDPTLPVNGVNPIGNWICRGQNSFPIPPAAPAAAYSATPFAFNSQYYLLNDGRGLTIDGYELPNGAAAYSVTGGIGALRGASGDLQFSPSNSLGTNATGCPNFRVKFNIQPGSMRGQNQ